MKDDCSDIHTCCQYNHPDQLPRHLERARPTADRATERLRVPDWHDGGVLRHEAPTARVRHVVCGMPVFDRVLDLDRDGLEGSVAGKGAVRRRVLYVRRQLCKSGETSRRLRQEISCSHGLVLSFSMAP